MCRKPADYYCKDTRLPVCSSDCKIAYIAQEQIYDRKDSLTNKSISSKRQQIVQDCLTMFKQFMKYAFQDNK